MNSLENKAKVWWMCLGASSDRNCEMHCADSVKTLDNIAGIQVLSLHNGNLKTRALKVKLNLLVFWFNYE